MKKIVYLAACLQAWAMAPQCPESLAAEPTAETVQEPAGSVAETERPKASNEQIFMESLQTMFPLTPEQIHDFRNLETQVKEAENQMPAAAIHSKSRPLSLETGTNVAPVLLTPLYVGALSFFDMTGAPWPVSRVVIGNEELFKLINSEYAKDDPKGDAHILYITPMLDHANSNILVFLEGANTPVSIPLVSSPSSKTGRQHDGMTSFIVSSRSPFAKAPVLTDTAPVTSPVMYAFLDGVPPNEAVLKKTSLEGDDCLVWELGGKLYLRTRYPLIFPAFRSHTTTGDVHVYEIGISPSFLLSKNGNTLTVDVK